MSDYYTNLLKIHHVTINTGINIQFNMIIEMTWQFEQQSL